MTTDNRETIHETIEMMMSIGGSFVRAIAHAYRCADEMNKTKLRIAFPEYFREYAAMAARNRERETYHAKGEDNGR